MASERPRELAVHHLSQALTRAETAAAQTHIEAALDELDTPTPLVECPACGTLGLPGRLLPTACPHD